MTSLTSWVNAFVEHAAQQAQSATWLSQLRQQALERFAAEGWPTTRLEAWRHTSLALMEQKTYELAQDSSAAADLVSACKQNEDAYWLTFINGQFDATASPLDTDPGVRLASVAQLLRDEPDTLVDIYGDVAKGASPEALNLALAQDGAYVRVQKGKSIGKPIHLVYVNTDAQSATFTRSFIALEAGAHATVVEHYLSTEDYAGLTNAVSRIWTDRDANLIHLKLQNQSDQSVHLAAVDAEQEQSSHYESHSLSFGANLARTGIETHFKGQYCHALLNGLYYVNARRHVDHYTQIHHAQPNCTSHEYYRGIMADRGRGVFSGRIIVYEGADGTDAIQRSDSLLLSKLARTDTKPELEIYADDVKCAHGATVGQIDEDSLFYLRSRGLNYEQAYNVLIYAFAAQVLERIQSDALRHRATQGIQNLLPDGKEIGEQV